MIHSWKKIAETVVNGQLQKTFLLPDGQSQTYTIKNDGSTCGIVAVTFENQFVICKQFRPGPEKILFECPGGFIEPNEAPLQAAKRELREETGYEGEMHFLGTNWISAYSNEYLYSYIAINCTKVSDPNLDQHEHIEIALLSHEEFINHIHTGNMTNIVTAYKGLDFLRAQKSTQRGTLFLI